VRCDTAINDRDADALSVEPVTCGDSCTDRLDAVVQSGPYLVIRRNMRNFGIVREIGEQTRRRTHGDSVHG
jgi:hypothetical protein